MSISNLFDGPNAAYAQDLYERYARNPESVPEEWREIFSRRIEELIAEGLITPDALREDSPGARPSAPAAPAPAVPALRESPTATAAPPAPPTPSAPADPRTTGTGDEGAATPRLLRPIARAALLIQAFRNHGHQLARLDPLGTEPPGHPQLDPAFFGTSIEDLAAIPTSLVVDDGGDEPLSDALQRLRESYCGSIGFQFEHLEDPARVRWLWNEVESGRHAQPLRREARLSLLRRLSEVEGLERFLHRVYLGQKRFSIEGNDMLVPMLDLAIERFGASGGRRVVLGMAHRGRLNVLHHIVGMADSALLREFEETARADAAPAHMPTGTGDVKYHRGAEGRYALRDGSKIAVTLAPNPSHLEFVDPVVMGMARALQFDGPGRDAKPDFSTVVPILIHGDAAFAAEGIVAESLNLARLRGYTVGGTVHIIVNNQVGFTTDPEDGRSTRYASDLAKGYDVPILHVNADDPEACLGAVRLAMAFREKFHDDVVIDLVGYRRYGHNEGDEPSYTQPLLYARIADHPTVRAQWAARLVSEGTLPQAEVENLEDAVALRLRTAQEEVEREEGAATAAPSDVPDKDPDPPETAVSLERLARVNAATVTVPEGFSLHPKLRRQLEHRRTDFGEGTSLDWAHAEALAIGSILEEGVAIRLTGQDSERGTFSQRHLVLHDVKTGAETTPLAGFGEGRFEIFNSPLSEAAALGFEYGVSVAAPESFVIWEAQFGDFANAAQVIVDQFIASGRAKWGQQSRLTLMLPHGYEGQGPEHSSARLERFLQIAAEENIRVANPTTPAQYFHLLRRQALGSPIRPLVIFTPKSLLRHPSAISPAADLTRSSFRTILPEDAPPGDPSEVTRLILCSGKVYYDLVGAEGRGELRHIAVGRIEGLYPFPARGLAALTGLYPNLEEVVWVQEEPRNMGALAYVGPRLRGGIPREVTLLHVARPERASPAEGKNRSHRIQQERIVREALGTE